MKTVFFIINTLLIAVTAYFCVEVLYKNMIPRYHTPPDGPSAKTMSSPTPLQPAEQNPHKDQSNIIVERNLFKVEVQEKDVPATDEDKAPETLEATTLKLVLWGTVTGDADVYAVIEDTTTRRQALYQVGDSVQEAEVKQIFRDRVILVYQGKNQVLEMKTDNKDIPGRGLAARNTTPGIPGIDRELPVQPAEIIGNPMNQIKFRPHFTEGEADGLMVYGIRPNSVFRKMGIRNGDIVKDMNGTPIVSAEDASQLLDEIEEAGTAKFTVFRRGKLQELFYDDQALDTDSPENE